jgi:hypothetical protein
LFVRFDQTHAAKPRHYRCFDRILLNGLIQPFQQPERVVSFFNMYRQLYQVAGIAPRDIADQFQRRPKERAAKRNSSSAPSSGILNPPRLLEAVERVYAPLTAGLLSPVKSDTRLGSRRSFST